MRAATLPAQSSLTDLPGNVYYALLIPLTVPVTITAVRLVELLSVVAEMSVSG